MKKINSAMLPKNLKRKLTLLCLMLTAICFTITGTAFGVGAVKQQLPERKQTPLGLYVTAKEAYQKFKAAPHQIKLIDVRTPEEYAFIGHPENAWNIPFAFVTYQRKDGTTEHGARMNDEFAAEVQKIAGVNDILFLMCRSGDRSARAVNKLAEAGFTNAYTITDGMEGDKVSDPANVYHGKRMKNGWKNSGAPWVYSVDTDRILIPEGTSK